MSKTTLTAFVLGVALLSGCAVSVFNSPVAISTRTSGVIPGKDLGVVSAERCTYMAILPFPFKPGDLYQDLLQKSEAIGGNAIRDMRVQNSSTGMFFVFGSDCWEATGTAIMVPNTK